MSAMMCYVIASAMTFEILSSSSMSIFLEERQPKGIWDEVTHVHTFKLWLWRREKTESPSLLCRLHKNFEDQFQLTLPESTF